ncbi:MAG: hypothetical protein HY548_08965, partial [Elusimicrobia bacterium]|nr:hypothetical protein [Elusimicrobiota bacterium]
MPSWLEPLAEAPVVVSEIQVGPSAGNRRRIVYLFQDVHEQPEPQLNLSKALEALQKQNPGLLIGLEGSSGPFRTAPYRRPPDEDIRRQAADVLLQKGLLSGPEHMAITAPREPELWGVESPEAYRFHVDSFKRSLPLEKQALEHLSSLAAHLDQACIRLYPPVLLEWKSKQNRFQETKTGLAEYLEFLEAHTESRRLEQIALFRESHRTEKSLSFEKVEQERRHALEQLSEILTEKELDELTRISLEYRLGRRSVGRFYEGLRRLCARHRFPLFERYPELDRYIRYVTVAERIEPEKFFQQLTELEKEAEGRLLAGPHQKEAFQFTQDMALLKRLVTRRLDSAGWKRYQARRKEIGRMALRLNELLKGASLPPVGGQNFEGLSVFEDFYAAAEKRNEALIANMLRKWESLPPAPAALVAGGFHTQGLARLLADKGISYAVVAPNITRVENGTQYLDVFRRGRTPLEKLFQGEKLTLKHTQALAVEKLYEGQAPLAGAAEGTFVSVVSLLQAVRLLKNEAGLSKEQRRQMVEWVSEGFDTVTGVSIEQVEPRRSAEDQSLFSVAMKLAVRGKIAGGSKTRRLSVDWQAPQAERPAPSANPSGDVSNPLPVFEADTENGRLVFYPATASVLQRLLDKLQASAGEIRTTEDLGRERIARLEDRLKVIGKSRVIAELGYYQHRFPRVYYADFLELVVAMAEKD